MEKSEGNEMHFRGNEKLCWVRNEFITKDRKNYVLVHYTNTQQIADSNNSHGLTNFPNKLSLNFSARIPIWQEFKVHFPLYTNPVNKTEKKKSILRLNIISDSICEFANQGNFKFLLICSTCQYCSQSQYFMSGFIVRSSEL